MSSGFATRETYAGSGTVRRDAGATGDGGLETPARRAGVRVPGDESRSRAYRHAQDLRPPGRRARGTSVPRRRAARQTPPLPDPRREARPSRPPDDGRPPEVPRAGEEGPKKPAFALEFQGGSKLVLTENARKKRA